jgi:hypothetical protein
MKRKEFSANSGRFKKKKRRRSCVTVSGTNHHPLETARLQQASSIAAA